MSLKTWIALSVAVCLSGGAAPPNKDAGEQPPPKASAGDEREESAATEPAPKDAAIVQTSGAQPSEKAQPTEVTQKPPDPEKPDPVPTPIDGLKEMTTESGVRYWDIKIGDGESPERDATITAHYSGWIKGGKLFDNTHERQRPHTFPLARNAPGFIDGMMGIKAGGRRRIEVPPEAGYPAGKGPPGVPDGATLIYEIEVLRVKNPIPEPVQTSTEGLNPISRPSGLTIWDIKVGDGALPKPNSIVTAHFSGWLPDGKLFYSTVKKGRPESFALDKVIKGLGEGISTMKVGGKRRLEIPYELGYGEAGHEPFVPPKSTLFFEVDLFDVSNPLPPPKQTSVKNLKEVVLPSGLKYWDIKVGDGATPLRTSMVTFHYSGWLTDETLFDSSVQRGSPLRMKLKKTGLEGWIEGISSMKVGGQRRLEIPPDLAFGEKGSPTRKGEPQRVPPNATVIYEVELLKVED
ncbi:MAG: FKBP-type peptidyl-prolyl cis-trans isomerase [Phycisphaerales bacterium]|nr:MAG: FKBP-type peptidyl-prolyl cis-trans isomerase [Phycisphaerales bacterium]